MNTARNTYACRADQQVTCITTSSHACSLRNMRLIQRVCKNQKWTRIPRKWGLCWWFKHCKSHYSISMSLTHTLVVNDLIFPKMDFLVKNIKSSSPSSPSMMAQLSAAGSSQSFRLEFITSLEYLYSNLWSKTHVECNENQDCVWMGSDRRVCRAENPLCVWTDSRLRFLPEVTGYRHQ